ncbi:MAG: HAD-IA family hydrolase [Gemmatimonadetes bacterium]|nr:HAD-IA family hydrolase [Gemmatimonadota bacterium]
MNIGSAKIDAVTFDFYNTLVYHRNGRGRGALLMEYFKREGLQSDPWEHQVLYDVFEQHGRDYSPSQSEAEKQRYFLRLTKRLFQRLNVRAPDGAVADHVASVWSVLGPSSLAVFPDVSNVLQVLRAARYRIAVVSNWQCGLRHFCTELGFGETFDDVIVSAEVGYEKPNAEIFAEACRRVGVPPHRVLHVGDSMTDDVEGARAAGLHALLVRRDQGGPTGDTPTIPSLELLPQMLGQFRKPHELV